MKISLGSPEKANRVGQHNQKESYSVSTYVSLMMFQRGQFPTFNCKVKLRKVEWE